MSKPIKNNSQLLYLQARQIFEKAKVKFEDGTIKSEPKLVESVFNAFQEFFTSMGKPNMVPRYAPEDGPPWSEDFNDMMNEIRQDLELLFQEADILGRSLYSDFNHNMIQHEIISKQYEEVFDKMRDLETYASLTSSAIEFGRDDFLNKDKIDYSRISGTPLEIVDGAVTLPQSSRVNVAIGAQVTIITGTQQKNKFILGTESNGFPGNNTEIHSVTDDVLTNKNYIPTFLGEENNHCDYTAVLDGSPNTWFEYEKVNVREHDRIRVAKNLGWDYQVHDNQTITWAEDPSDGILKLHMQIILKEEKVINQINCNMYTPPSYNAKTAIVKNILVSDGKTVPKSVIPKNKKDDQYSFHFPPVNAKVISIVFEQPQKYITDIGHIFYEKRMQIEDKSEYAMDAATKKYKYAPRVEGPLISLEDLGIGVKVDASSVEAAYPLLDAKYRNNLNIGETINRLMSNVDSETIDMGVEKFEGFRWCIGIRDIEIYSCEYEKEGELVTHPFYFDNPLDKISLNVNENVPKEFAMNDAMKYDWLKYFISIDDGATWHPITPMSHEVFSKDQPPKIYTVRNIETSGQKLEYKDAYLESEYPVYSLRMKILAQRPTEDSASMMAFRAMDTAPVKTTDPHMQASPIVNSYRFNALTIDEVFSSHESDKQVATLGQITDKPNTGDPNNPDGGTGGNNGGGGNGGNGGNGGGGNGGNPGGGGGNGGNGGGEGEHWAWDPNGDDNGDGIPNWKDPTWRPPLTAQLYCKRTEWCKDEDIVFEGQVFSANELTKIEILINGEVKMTKKASGRWDIYAFVFRAGTFEEGTITAVIRVYDVKGISTDSDVINIISCAGMAPSDRPQECKSKRELNVVVDKKPKEICECKELSFYGSAQGPNSIKGLLFYINGVSIDPNGLGTPPIDDPCGTPKSVESNVPVANQVVMKVANQMSEQELLEIEDFGEWLDAFEEQNDCGCKNKKKRQQQSEPAPMFQMQATPFEAKASDEQSFNVKIPYWKLRELGVKVGSKVKVEVKAYDAVGKEASNIFEVEIKDCEDDNKVRDCYLLEAVEVHFLHQANQAIHSMTVPANMLPYEIENGIGTAFTVGWNQTAKGPVIMQTRGFEESGYSCQIHAVGIHYLDRDDAPQTKWSIDVIQESDGVRNKNKMTGDATKQPAWLDEIKSVGDYSFAPGFSKLYDYATFTFDNEWNENACDVDSNYVPSEHMEQGPKEQKYDCNQIMYVMYQVYDEVKKELKLYRVDQQTFAKPSYDLTTKNGSVKITVGWVSYFKGPAVQIKTGAGEDNLLLTGMGIIYRDRNGDSQSAWVDGVRYKTNGVRNPEFVIGSKKTMADIGWISNGTVDYSRATYVGKQGDIAGYTISEDFFKEMCPPRHTIDKEIGVDPNNPTDVPKIVFLDKPKTVCIDDGNVEVKASVTDSFALKEITMFIAVNGEQVYGPFTSQVEGKQQTITFPINTTSLEEGDSIRLEVTVKNSFDITATDYLDIFAENCDESPPVIVSFDTTMAKMEDKYCYKSIGADGATFNFRITDDKQVASWSATSSFGWTDEGDFLDSTNRVTDTGVVSIKVPVPKPQPLTDANNKQYLPDMDYKITLTAKDRSGKTATKEFAFTMKDCEYNPNSGTEEGNITNPFKVKLRLRWGASPKDMDIHVFVGKNPSRRLSYSIGGGDLENQIKASYTDSKGTMYLNYDWRDHDSQEDWDTEYEVVTVDGFANETLSIVVHNFSGETVIGAQVVTEDRRLKNTYGFPGGMWPKRYFHAFDVPLDAEGYAIEVIPVNKFSDNVYPTV